MEDGNTWVTVMGYLLTPIAGVVSWIAARRARNNSTLRDLQSTIDMLVEKNKELYQTITELNAEVMSLRSENAELKQGQADMLTELGQLRDRLGIKKKKQDNENNQ